MIDTSINSQNFIEDCEVCCNPLAGQIAQSISIMSLPLMWNAQADYE